MRAKWSAPIRKYWKISEQMMVKYCDLAICDSVNSKKEIQHVIPRFRLTTVFDISQTDGEPIPSLEVNELTASVKDYALLTAAIEQVSPVPIRG